MASRSRDMPNKSTWGRLVGNISRDIIPTQRLPTNRVILQRYHTLRTQRSNRTSVHDFAKELYDEILPIWQRANIPTLSKKTCVSRLVALLSSWKEKDCRKFDTDNDKELQYVTMLDSLFKMSHLDKERVKEDLKSQRLLQKNQSSECQGLKTWEIDFMFYEYQLRHPQVGSIGSEDTVLESRRKERSSYYIRKEEVKRKVRKLDKENSSVLTEKELDETIGEDDTECFSDPEPDYVPVTNKRMQKKYDKVMLELPTKDLSKNTAELCARLKLSHRSATTLFAKVIISGGGDLKDFVLSKSSSYRQRILGEKEAEDHLKLETKELSSDCPYAIVHFDGKKIKYESGDIQERLVICLQQVCSITQPRFIGAPQLPDGKGVSQCEALIRYIDKHGIENQLVGHCWDTTSANTGCNIGAAILLDKACGKAHLWFACRRHAAERHCVHANTQARGPTKSPEEQLFKHFKENFEFLNLSNVQKFSWLGDEISPTGPYLYATERAMEVRKRAEKCCEDGVFPREDYRELLELLTWVLGGQIKRKLLRGTKIVQFKMQRPGAFDHVRFMAKAIYYIKMLILLPELIGKRLVTDIDVITIKRMSNFIILLYGQYFLQTALTTSAPRVDLEFWRAAKKYDIIDKEISDAVVNSIHRQMYYLTEELVLLALCDVKTSETEKGDLVKKLLEQDRPQSFQPKKPEFKVHLLLGKTHEDPCLSDFVGPRSWLMFDLFDVNVTWMGLKPNDWPGNEHYERFKKLLNGVICVNDVAERNVQNVMEYCNYSKDSDRRDRVVKVVNHHRELVDFHKLNKEELSKL